MNALILVLSAACFFYLLCEKARAVSDRKKLKHVIHVNGTRGKSSTTRLIDAALREAGMRVYTKTTGTEPRVITPDGEERPLKRRGRANIREQLRIMHDAVRTGAEVLCIECMAVAPEYQYASQHRMLRADIGVITNVRYDHTEVMGETLPEIAEALSNTVPEGGVLFTNGAGGDPAADAPGEAEEAMRVLARVCADRGTSEHKGTVPLYSRASLAEIDWPENVGLALAVAAELGVREETALRGMRTRYRRDPYALSVHRLSSGARFVNAFSANDASSIRMIFDRAVRDTDGKRILLVNTRADRAARTAQMARLAHELPVDEVWLTGPGSRLLASRIGNNVPFRVTFIPAADKTDLSACGANDLIFATGNLAGEGVAWTARVRQEGTEDVL